MQIHFFLIKENPRNMTRTVTLMVILFQFLYVVKTGSNYKYKNYFCDTNYQMVGNKYKVDVKIGHLDLNMIFWTIFIRADHCA